MDIGSIIILAIVCTLLLLLIPLFFISFKERNKSEKPRIKNYGDEYFQTLIQLDKGERGEYIVDRMLKEVSEFAGGYAYRELKLEDEYGNWTEIDNVFISPIGIYLIETKNRDGIITGDETSNKWIQTSGRYTHEVDNPIIQCQRHEKFFKRVIKNVGSVTTLTIFVAGDISNIKCKNVFTLKGAEEFLMNRKRMLSDSKIEYINSQVLKFVKNPPFTHGQYSNWMENQKRTNSNFS